MVLLFVRGTANAHPIDVQARWDDGKKADQELRFADALAAFDDVIEAEPSGNAAYDARKRAEILRARAEGDFVPLKTLTLVRRSGASDAKAIDDLVKAADGWPSGLVRVEAWQLAASAYADRLGRPQEAERLLRKVLADKDVDHDAIRGATRDLVHLRLRAGDHAGADLVAREAGPHLDDDTRRLVARVLFRDQLHTASIVVLAVPTALAIIGWIRAARAGRSQSAWLAARKALPLALAYAAYVAIAGAALALGYEAGTSKPFLFFGLALLPLVLLARAWGAAGAQTRVARLGRALVCAASAFGLGFLILEHVNVAFLEGLGL